MIEKPRKFETLEALRGIAALLVVWHHFPELFGSYKPPNIFLAVDLFFGLSGFVLSYAYQKKIDAGLPTTTFLVARLIRLWPLYALSMVGGLLISSPLHPSAGPLKELIGKFVVAIPFLPWFNPKVSSFLYPLNPPAWTLLMELLANAAHSLFARNLKTRTLAAWCGLLGASLFAAYCHYGSLDGGSGWDSVPLGLARVLFSYSLGMVLFRLRALGFGNIRVPVSVPCAILAAILMSNPSQAHRGVVYAIALVVLFPALLLVSSWNEPKSRWEETAFAWLGSASYGVYVLHSLLARTCLRLWPAAVRYSPWSGIVVVIALVNVVFALDRFYDLPLRKHLRKSLQRQEPHPQRA